jgi:predicted Zn-dependent protease
MPKAGAEGDEARSTLRSLLAVGNNPAMIHFVLGADAWEREHIDEARMHWEQAHQLNPRLPEVANNLAWLYAMRTNPPDLPRALRMINLVLEGFPTQARFKGTRGHILAKMERWKEALPDLEASLTVYPDDPNLHQVLATAYERLGDPEMAKEHRRRAEAKKPAPPAGPPEKPGKPTPEPPKDKAKPGP